MRKSMVKIKIALVVLGMLFCLKGIYSQPKISSINTDRLRQTTVKIDNELSKFNKNSPSSSSSKDKDDSSSSDNNQYYYRNGRRYNSVAEYESEMKRERQREEREEQDRLEKQKIENEINKKQNNILSGGRKVRVQTTNQQPIDGKRPVVSSILANETTQMNQNATDKRPVLPNDENKDEEKTVPQENPAKLPYVIGDKEWGNAIKKEIKYLYTPIDNRIYLTKAKLNLYDSDYMHREIEKNKAKIMNSLSNFFQKEGETQIKNVVYSVFPAFRKPSEYGEGTIDAVNEQINKMNSPETIDKKAIKKTGEDYQKNAEDFIKNSN
jgi:hypothetical protein